MCKSSGSVDRLNGLGVGWGARSNQIIFIGLRSSKDHYKLPGGGVGIWEVSLGCEFLRGSMGAEGMGCGRRCKDKCNRIVGISNGMGFMIGEGGKRDNLFPWYQQRNHRPRHGFEESTNV